MSKTEKIYHLVLTCNKKYLESYLDKNGIIATVMGRNAGCCSLYCKEKTIKGLGELKNLIITIANDAELCNMYNRIFTKVQERMAYIISITAALISVCLRYIHDNDCNEITYKNYTDIKNGAMFLVHTYQVITDGDIDLNPKYI